MTRHVYERLRLTVATSRNAVDCLAMHARLCASQNTHLMSTEPIENVWYEETHCLREAGGRDFRGLLVIVPEDATF
jgi:hypothetical protein